MQVDREATSVILFLELLDNAGDRITGVAYDSGSLAFLKIAPGDTGATTVTLVDGTVGTYLANSWKETDVPGIYQFCPPDAWITPGGFVVIEVTYTGNRPQTDTIESVSGAFVESTSIDTDITEWWNPESLEITWTRGDDYLVANCREIDIEITDDCGGTIIAGSTAFFRASDDNLSVTIDATAEVVDVSGTLYLRITATRAQTSAEAAGSYNWDAEIQDENGYVKTNWSGRLRLVESWTALIA